jgi:hypothetical protein
MTMTQVSRLLGAILLLGTGAVGLEAAPAMQQGARGALQDATRQQAVGVGEDPLLERIEAIQGLLDRCLSMGRDAVCQAVRLNADKRHEGVRRGQLAEVESIIREDIEMLRQAQEQGPPQLRELRSRVLALEEELLSAVRREMGPATSSIRRQVYETTIEIVHEGRVVRIPGRVELTTVAAERAHCQPTDDLMACRLAGGVDPDLFCWGSGIRRACPRGVGGGITPGNSLEATARRDPVEVLAWSWGRAIVDPDDDENTFEYAWFLSGEGREADLIGSVESVSGAVPRADEGAPSETLSLSFTKIELAAAGTPPGEEGSIRVPLERVEPGLHLVRVALHRRDLPLCGVTNHFLFGTDCDDTDPPVRPGLRGTGDAPEVAAERSSVFREGRR